MDESFSLLAVRTLSVLQAERGRGMFVIVDGEQKAEHLTRLLAQLDPTRAAFHFPAWDCLPYDRAAPSADLMGHRMRVLTELAAKPQGIVVTTPEAAVQRVPPRAAMPKPLMVKAGGRLDAQTFAARCADLGYLHADRVDDPGHVAVRGEVIDIFPAGPRPYRIGLDHGHVTMIHRYDPVSQRSTDDVRSIRIHAITELVVRDTTVAPFEGIEHWWPEFCGRAESLFAVLPDAALMLDPAAERRLTQIFAGIAEAHRDRLAADRAEATAPRHALQPTRLYVSADEWTAATAERRVAWPSADDAEDVPRFCLVDKPGQAFAAYVEQCLAKGARVVLSGMRERELALLAKQAERVTGQAPARVAGWSDLPAPGTIGVLRLAADHGFADAATGAVLITVADLLGHHARAVSSHAVPVPWHLGDGDFATGDLVIHLDHGVGLLKGLESVTASGGGGYEALRLGYAGEADLLVPADALDRVWRYGGAAGDVPLDRLGSQAWPKRQARIAKDIAAAAQGLVESARRRKGTKAAKAVPPRRAYERFVAGFTFAPTADQMHAIDDCLRDLATDTPMDRLVVGDVGFGKTEVALRAAAAAVLAGFQVAVIAPTTVLAGQHVQSFKRRFAELGIEVARLCRLASPQEAERVKAGLASGDIRLVVGTQALCGNEVAFNNLGLLIVDEEQRFGAGDKERVRALGAGTHVLTLTATPIPRTLQAALVGLQDISIIATPPARRRPIRTLLAPFDLAALRTALLKEKAHGGQSFVVVPRIEDMTGLSATLADLVPELSLCAAHGQMDTETIEAAMSGFAAGDGDVLLATSIIESGLDVPRANTMVICRADRFGLAELHQLRGRVGRGQRQGVCYLLTAPDQVLAPATERRLTTLARLDRLGSGMAISAQDLDARGGGDLIGEEQAGHSHLIGLGLYQHLLHRALREAGSDGDEDWAPELHLGDGGGFGADYLPEPDVRINLYARVARAMDVHDLDLLAEEIEDRFGPLPDAARALLARARLRCLCRSRSIARVDAGPKAIAFTPRPGTAPEALLNGASRHERAVSRIKGGRLLFAIDEAVEAGERLTLTTHLLQTLA